MNQTQGMSAWRWLFLLEGLPSVISSVFVWFFLPDYPETASWLSTEEKDLAAHRLAEQGSHGGSKSLTWAEAKETLLEWRLWAHYCVRATSLVLWRDKEETDMTSRSTLVSRPRSPACLCLRHPSPPAWGYVMHNLTEASSPFMLIRALCSMRTWRHSS